MLGLSPEHLLVLVLAALFILGPERLPGALSFVRKATLKAKDALAGAQRQIEAEVGPEFAQLRKPLGELNRLRGMDPRAALTRFVFDPPPAAAAPAPEPEPVPQRTGSTPVDPDAT